MAYESSYPVVEQDENESIDKISDQTITVTGLGSAEAPPDRAIVSMAIVVEGDDPATVRSGLDKNADALRQALTAVSVADDQIKTTDYRIQETFHDDFDENGTEPEYRGTHSFQVTLNEVSRAGTVTDAAVDAGAQIQWISFTLSNDREIHLRDQALTNAIASARQQANTLAAAGDLEVLGVHEIDASDRQFDAFDFEERAFEDIGETGTTFESDDIAVSVHVHVTYDATPRKEA